MLFQPMPRPTHSQWGAIEYARQELPGIWWVSTASHGGFIVSPERRSAMQTVMREFQTFAGGNSYEEDGDWAVVILAYATEFTEEQIQAAVRTIAASAAFEGVSAPARAQLRAIQDYSIAAASAAQSPGIDALLATREDASRAVCKAGAT